MSKTMKQITKLKLASVHQICDVNDKSTEFMIQLMQDVCSVDLDTVISYLEKTTQEEKAELFKRVNAVNRTIIKVIDISPSLLT